MNKLRYFIPCESSSSWPCTPIVSPYPGIYIIICILVVAKYLQKFASYGEKASIFSAAPGALGPLMILAENEKTDLSQVATSHLIRLIIIITVIPFIIVNNTGNGDVPDINSIVTVAYKGTLTDGTIFDQSGTSGATFPLSNVIQGWQEGIPLYSEGGSGILLIPSALGYGSQAVGSIPANSVLIFEVTLLNVN